MKNRCLVFLDTLVNLGLILMQMLVINPYLQANWNTFNPRYTRNLYSLLTFVGLIVLIILAIAVNFVQYQKSYPHIKDHFKSFVITNMLISAVPFVLPMFLF